MFEQRLEPRRGVAGSGVDAVDQHLATRRFFLAADVDQLPLLRHHFQIAEQRRRERQRALDVVAKGALAPGLRAAVVRAMEMRTAAQVAYLVTKAAEKAAVRERGHPAKQGGSHSFPTSARIPMMTVPIPMASIRRSGCGSRGSAIDLIIGLEPALHRTPEGNPGFDLFEADSDGRQIRWVEVKSMTGTLEDRPVGLSHTQFDCAREKGDAYWLYVVERATDPANARVLRIQNPSAMPGRSLSTKVGGQSRNTTRPDTNRSTTNLTSRCRPATFMPNMKTSELFA